MKSHGAVFHADLSGVRGDVRCFISVAGTLHPLEPHTAESRLRARGSAPHLARVADERLTHFTPKPVGMSHGAAIRVHVAYRTSDGKRPPKGPHAGHAAIYVPPSEAELRAAGGELVRHQHVDWISTAKAFLFHHADLHSGDPAVAGVVMDHMDEDQARATYALIEELAAEMREAGEPSEEEGEGWAKLDPVEYEVDKKKATYYLHQPREQILAKAQPAMKALMHSTKNDTRLKDKKWTQLEGVSTRTLEPHKLGTLRADGAWSASLASDFYVNGVKTSVTVEDAAQRILRVEMENIYVRYLAAYVRFLDAQGKPLNTSGWQPEGGLPIWVKFLQDAWAELRVQEDDFRLLGTIDPIDTILAVPNPLLPGRLTGQGSGWGVGVRFPEGAASAGLYACGLGTGSKPHAGAVVYGSAFTIVCNLFVPSIMIAFDVASKSYRPLYDFIQDVLKNKAVLIVGAIVYLLKNVGGFVLSAIEGHPDWKTLASMAKTLFGTLFGWLLEWIEKDLAENAVENAAEKVAEQIPFAGWIVSAVAIVSSVAQMAETVVEVISSPWEIPNTVHTQITSTVRLRPDPVHGAFPHTTAGEKASWSVSMVHKSGGPARLWHGDAPPETPKEIAFEFSNPLGDLVKLEAAYFVEGELRGQASTGWLPNDPENAKEFLMLLVEKAVPLGAASVYRHASLFGYRNGAYAWIQTDKAPDAVYRPDTSQTGNALSEWNGLALSQRWHRLGWAWKAAGTGLADCAGGGVQQIQLHALATAGIPGADVKDVFARCGFAGRSNLVCDPFPPRFKMKDGQWVLVDGRPVPDPDSKDLGSYYVDPRKADRPLEEDGGFHLRRIDADGPIDPGGGLKSFGRFRYAPESMAIHPAGYVVGLSHEFCKIQVARLPPGGAADDALPVAPAYSGQGTDFNGSGGRAGLLVQPIAVACAYDGTLLILENLFSEAFKLARIQAFDVHGNPVSCFRDSNGAPSPFLELPAAGRTYLDLAVVGGQRQASVFALYSEGGGRKPGDYHVAVYQYGDPPPARNPLLTTGAFPAARIAADLWNTLYALNYEMTTDGAGQAAGPKGAGTGPAGRTVPSLSAWVPRAPKSRG